MKPAWPAHPLIRRSLLAAAALCVGATPLAGQGALDPSVSPRAAALAREGQRALATGLLGRYLATAPDDGYAWLQLGRFYRLDAEDWHMRGHTGEPDGPFFLDVAALALDQASRLMVDSGVVLRSMVEMDRALLFLEDAGWEGTRETRPRVLTAALPGYILELGRNLLGSCPAGGVLATGSDLETLAVWYASLESGVRPDVQPIRPSLYALDSRYRAQMARSLGVDSAWAIQQALVAVAGKRPICLTPLADRAAAPLTGWVPIRLVMVAGAKPRLTDDVVSVVSLLQVAQDPSAWVRDTRAVYQAAARENRRLCGGLLAHLEERWAGTCGQ